MDMLTPPTVPLSQPADASMSPEKDLDGPTNSSWGRLLPLTDEGFPVCQLESDKNEYTFGRGEDVDFSFCSTNVATKNKFFASLSKLHFKIVKEETKNGFHVFIEDKSSNGTYLDGTKIGKNNRRLLPNNSEIALAHKDNKVYVFNMEGDMDDVEFPKELRKRFDVSKKLGSGAMGEVRLVFEKPGWHKYAVKIIKKSKLTVKGMHKVDYSKSIQREIDILKALAHPCIIRIEDVYDSDDTSFLILELVEGGELFDRIVNGPNGRFEESLAKFYFYQMIHAIKYLHDQKIGHRDLKPENILLCSDDNETLLKITDFGLSKFIDGASMLKTYCGTPNYLAPEILMTQGTGTYTEKVDLWSLGVILFVSLSGYPPFSNDYKDMPLCEQILQGRLMFNSKIWKNISADAVDLVKKLLTVDPNQRISATESMAHPWLQDDEMKTKAHMLMYPHSDGMIPPTTRLTPGSPGKKRGRVTTEENEETVHVEPTTKRQR